MSTEEGTITQVTEDKAWVRIRRSGMCDACKCRSTCSTLGGNEIMEAEALNVVNAQPGDRVVLQIPSKSLWKISFILYLLPVFSLIAGVVAGMKLASVYSLEPELGAFILGALGCIIAVVIIKLFASRVQKNKEYIPEVIRVL
jgi:sigma-E factor negative regulatory protein RseC